MGEKFNLPICNIKKCDINERETRKKSRVLTAVQETANPRHHGGAIKAPLKHLNTSIARRI